MIDIAHAMPAPGGGADAGGPAWAPFVMMAAIFGIFYFLLIRPQQKKAAEHKTLLENLKKGDSVITQGGLFGKVVALSDQVVTLEIADKIKVRVSRAHIAGLAPLSDSQTTS